MNPYRDKDLRKFIESIPQDEVERQARLQDEETKRIYNEFSTAIKDNKCFICGLQMDAFDEVKPCFHWFTHPKGIRKKHFEKYLGTPIGFFQLDSYFRWLANTEKPIGNINDLKEETSKSSFLETTVKYKNIEWAFSIGHTDKEGHSNSQVGYVPHYHLQMKVDDRVFLKFNDFHIPFSDDDLFTIEMLEKVGDKVIMGHRYGEGIGILENEDNIDLILNAMIVADDESTAPFRLQTLIQAPEGQTISGEIIQQAIDESNRTKQPMGIILQRLLSDASITTIITPGDGVPKMTKRSGKS